jgi:putative SOS response-associated peptidase YedK
MKKINDRQYLHITEQMVRQWIGSNNLNVDYLVNLLTELADGRYSAIDFSIDVNDYHQENLEA